MGETSTSVAVADIDAVINSTSLTMLSDDKGDVFTAWVTDMAQDIFSREEICARYGMTLGEMLDLVRRPGVAQRIKERRAVFRSGESLQERARAYYGVVAMEAAQRIDKIIHDKTTTPSSVLDAVTIVSRNAGLYNGGGGKQGDGSTQIGAQFSVNIIFPGGKTETMTITQSPTVEEAT